MAQESVTLKGDSPSSSVSGSGDVGQSEKGHAEVVVAGHAAEELQPAEVVVAGRADEASAAALEIKDSRITVHCDLGSEASGEEMSLLPSDANEKSQAAELNVVGRAAEELRRRS